MPHIPTPEQLNYTRARYAEMKRRGWFMPGTDHTHHDLTPEQHADAHTFAHHIHMQGWVSDPHYLENFASKVAKPAEAAKAVGDGINAFPTDAAKAVGDGINAFPTDAAKAVGNGISDSVDKPSTISKPDLSAASSWDKLLQKPTTEAQMNPNARQGKATDSWQRLVLDSDNTMRSRKK